VRESLAKPAELVRPPDPMRVAILMDSD